MFKNVILSIGKRHQASKLVETAMRASARALSANAVHKEMDFAQTEQSTIESEVDSYSPWIVQPLHSKELINQVKALMYKVFVKEMGWIPAKNTPSGFAITTSETGEKIITDDLDSQGVWFGVIRKNQVIAGCRRLHRDALGHLDLTRYPSSLKPNLATLLSPDVNPNLAELQRTVIDPQFRGNSVLSCLFHYAFTDSYEKGLNMIGSAASLKLKTILRHHLQLQLVDNNFYYSENMEGPAEVFYLPRDEIPRVLKIFGSMVRHGNRC